MNCWRMVDGQDVPLDPQAEHGGRPESRDGLEGAKELRRTEPDQVFGVLWTKNWGMRWNE